MSWQPSVVVMTDDAEFPRLVAGRWQSERRMPSLTVLGGDLPAGCGSDGFQLAIVGPVPAGSLTRILTGLAADTPAVILVTDEAEVEQQVRVQFPRVLVMRQREGWLDMLVLLSTEVLRRVEAQGRAARAEASQAACKRNAVLGQFMIEMRHNLNNALTSILGHSELLLLEPGAMGAGERAQVTTIRNMGLRMHEILQRFSSLEKELLVAETPPEMEWRPRRAVAVQ